MGVGFERLMEPCGPEAMEEAEVGAEEEWECVKRGGLEKRAEFVKPVDACAEEEGAGDPAEEEGAPGGAVACGKGARAQDRDEWREGEPGGPVLGEGRDGDEEESG